MEGYEGVAVLGGFRPPTAVVLVVGKGGGGGGERYSIIHVFIVYLYSPNETDDTSCGCVQ